jgi:hypothetical protein
MVSGCRFVKPVQVFESRSEAVQSEAFTVVIAVLSAFTCW